MSDSFDGFDENDHFEIGDAMRRLTGPTPSTDDAFTGFRRRVRRAHIQRTAATVGAAAAVAALALGIPALVRAGNSNEVPVQSGGVSLPTDTSVDGSGTDGSNDGYNPAGGSGASGTPNGESGSSGGTSSGGSGGSSSGGSASGVRGTTGGGSGGAYDDGSDDGSNDDNGSGSGDDSGNDDASGNDSGPTGSSGTATVDLTKTCSAAGGSVTARRLNGVLSITSATPASGFVEDRREIEDDRVAVEFRSDELETRVIVRFGAASATCSVGN